jgi:hypothetical protein
MFQPHKQYLSNVFGGNNVSLEDTISFLDPITVSV